MREDGRSTQVQHLGRGAVQPAPLTIDCAECVMEGTGACGDCVVTFVVGRSPGDALIIDAAVERDLRALGSAGLVPDLRHRARAV